MTDVAALEGREMTLRDLRVVRNLRERDAPPNARIPKHSSEFCSLGLLVRDDVSAVTADGEIKNLRALPALIHGRRRWWGMHKQRAETHNLLDRAQLYQAVRLTNPSALCSPASDAGLEAQIQPRTDGERNRGGPNWSPPDMDRNTHSVAAGGRKSTV
jgi:hypothetical protein